MIDAVLWTRQGHVGQALPFDPSNPYVRYRMNIWSNTSGPPPKTTGNFTGDVFSSDTATGTFSVFSDTGVRLISSVAGDAPKPIYRLVYQLAKPLALAAGEYWFSHDASIRAQPALNSTTQSLTVDDLQRFIAAQERPLRRASKVFLSGVELTMEDSWVLASPSVVRPNRPVEQH